MSGRLHGLDDFVGHFLPSDAGEGPGKTPRDNRMAAFKERAEDFGHILDSGENNMNLGGVTPHEILGRADKRRGGFEQAKPVLHRQVHRVRHLAFEIVKRRAEQQLDRVIRTLRAVDDDLRRNDGIFRMQQQRLLGREVPIRAKSVFAIARAKFPE